MTHTSTQDIANSWHSDRVDHLRTALAAQGLDALIVPRWDRQHFEYVPLCQEKLAWLTGFSGSWGLAIVTSSELLLFVDSRYEVQANQQPNAATLTIRHLYDQPPEAWLATQASAGLRIGYDGEVISPAFHDRLLTACSPNGIELVPVTTDPFVQAWPDRPHAPDDPAIAMGTDWAGQAVTDKCAVVADMIQTAKADYLVDVLPDNVAWLLNARGSDLDYCPVALGRVLIDSRGHVDLFASEAQYAALCAPLAEQVTLHPADHFLAVIRERVDPGKRVLIDGNQGPQAVRTLFAGSNICVDCQPSPITDLKALKNPTERQAMRLAASEESVAWVRLLRWLEDAVAQGETPNELAVEEKMEALRGALPDYWRPSFRTIAAADSNGAMAHYAAPADGGKPIGQRSIFLLDSGGQFRNGGTTDTTRTWCFDTPPAEVLHDATLALKGHITLASQVFPDGTFGHSLDTLARMAAWNSYRDYQHGTGHGVGHYLSVHEFPQRLQKAGTQAPLREHMVITIEPGLYREGAYGIRHEILYQIVAAGEPGWLTFEPLAWVPFNRRLIDKQQLTGAEIQWLDDYHRGIWTRLSERLPCAQDREWLRQQTRPL